MPPAIIVKEVLSSIANSHLMAQSDISILIVVITSSIVVSQAKKDKVRTVDMVLTFSYPK